MSVPEADHCGYRVYNAWSPVSTPHFYYFHILRYLCTAAILQLKKMDKSTHSLECTITFVVDEGSPTPTSGRT
jgi:hypothetical protein